MCRRPRPLLAVALLLLLACSTLSGPQRSRRWRFRSSRVRSAEKLASLEKRIVEMEKEYKTMMKTFKGVNKMVKKVFNITKKAEAASALGRCRRGFTGLAGGLCVTGVSPAPRDREAAAAACRAGHGRLLQLETRRKFALVRQLLTDDRQLWLGAKYRANPQRDFFWDAGGKRLKFRVKGRTDGGANCVVLIMFRSPGDFATLDCQLPRYFVCEQAD